MSSLFELVEGFESSLDMLSCGLGVLEALEQLLILMLKWKVWLFLLMI